MSADFIGEITAGAVSVADFIGEITAYGLGGSGVQDFIGEITAFGFSPGTQAPYTLSAGPDQSVEPDVTVTITLTPSSGTPDTYQLDQLSGPNVLLNGSDTNTITFVAPRLPNGALRVLTFRGYATTSPYLPASDDVTITIYPHTGWQGDRSLTFHV